MFSSRIKHKPDNQNKRNQRHCFRLSPEQLWTNFQNILMYGFDFILRKRKLLNKKAFFEFLTVKTRTELNEIYCAHRALHDEPNSENRDFLSRCVLDRRRMPLYTRSSQHNSRTRSPMRTIFGLTVQHIMPGLSAKFGENWPICSGVMPQRVPECPLWPEILSACMSCTNQILSVHWSQSLASSQQNFEPKLSAATQKQSGKRKKTTLLGET